MFQLPIFLARKLSQDKYQNKRQSPLLRLSLYAISLSLMVMLISLTIISGFKRQTSNFAYSQTGHMSIYPYGNVWLKSRSFFNFPEACKDLVRQTDEVLNIEGIVSELALLKTKENFEGIQLYGVEEHCSLAYFKEHISSGTMPSFLNQDSIYNPIVLPSQIAKEQHCKIGDNIRLYFFNSSIKLRSYKLVGIYESAGIKQMPALCPIASLRKLNKLSKKQYSRILIEVKNPNRAEEIADKIKKSFAQNSNLLGESQVSLNTGKELLPDLFLWLELLDSNVYLIIILMLLVGACSMITGLIIIILDKRQQIGILKAQGIQNIQIRLCFTFIASKLMFKGMLWANLLAFCFCFIQDQFKIIGMNPDYYYMDSIPIRFQWELWLGVNLGTILLLMFLTLITSSFISKIKPAEIMRED